jgi:hypothetical protein
MNNQKQLHQILSVCLFIVCSFNVAWGFELSPLPTNSERLMAKKQSGIQFRTIFPIIDFGLHTFSNPVHETLTQLGYDCGPTIEDCENVDLDFANTGVIAGVRWNDDPPFQFKEGQGRYKDCQNPAQTISFALNTKCWIAHFKDISAIADAKPDTYTNGNGTMLARTHFGDLQFLHSMAISQNVSPSETKANLMMWAEFTWRVQSGASDRITADTRTGAITIPGFNEHFPVNEQRTVSDLFTVGRPWLRHQLGDIAFGSLIHMVEDSFAGGHVERRSSNDGVCKIPEIVEFHTYAGQDKDSHKEHDDFSHAKTKLVVVDIIKQLVWMRENYSTWAEVKPYLDNCVFRLAADARYSSTKVSD